MDTEKLFFILIYGGYFAAAFAGFVSSFLMLSVVRKSGKGVLIGLKSVLLGIFLIAMGIFIDAINSYLLANNLILGIILVIKEVFFVVGAYVIIVGSKKTADNIESLTK